MSHHICRQFLFSSHFMPQSLSVPSENSRKPLVSGVIGRDQWHIVGKFWTCNDLLGGLFILNQFDTSLPSYRNRSIDLHCKPIDWFPYYENNNITWLYQYKANLASIWMKIYQIWHHFSLKSYPSVILTKNN